MTDSRYAEASPHAGRPGSQGGAQAAADGVRPLPNGHRLAGFELDSVLGTGGFGIVYRAFDRTLQRAVAVKEYMPAMLASRAGDFTVALRAARFSQAFDAGRAAFLNEARLLAQFDHPGLVKVLHFWESHGTAYMVMPFYEGQTLEQLHKGGKRMSEPALLRMLASVLGALDVLHRAQCFHRDISLDNILILPNGNPVLLDFGAARKLIGDMVDETAMMLKPGYAPIEQYTDDPAFRQGPWTDIYALGALAHALMTGELPPAAVVRSIQDQYRPLAGREQEHQQEHYSERVRAAIDYALRLRIEDRPESVVAFAQALGLHEPTPGVFVPAGYDAPARAAGQGGERGAAVAGAAVAGATVAGALGATGTAAAAARDASAGEASAGEASAARNVAPNAPDEGTPDAAKSVPTPAAKAADVAAPEASASSTSDAEASPNTPANEQAASKAAAGAVAASDSAATPARPRESESAQAQQQPQAQAQQQPQPVAQQPVDKTPAPVAVARQDNSASESSGTRFAWRAMRIPALVLLLVLAVGIPALRYAIRTPAGSTQTAARNSAPATPTAPASHATALAQTAPAANPPAQPAAGNANPATQAQQQAAVATSGAATSAALTPGSGTPAAETAQTTNTTVVEVHAGKDKPVNATDLSAASQQ
ncbi:MAG: serine/threonine protein kinase, partial [Paraburkholderia sp.]|nr:serine/threonine protein kinase [Paraburkholderia sp.]